MRTDDNRNPTAFTTDIADQAGLRLGIDYDFGTPFSIGLYTAKLLGNPIELTIQVINKLGFVTYLGKQRWVYINLPTFVWNSLFDSEKRDVIGFMYRNEGGTAMIPLFPNYHLT